MKYKIIKPKNYKRLPLPYFKEWVTALESGSYSQTTGVLAAPNGKKKVAYCCLGILCRVQGRLKKDSLCRLPEWIDGNVGDYSEISCLSIDNPSYKSLRDNGRFPKGVSVKLTDGNTASSLIDCNDELHLTFKEIAKVIRAIWKNAPKPKI